MIQVETPVDPTKELKRLISEQKYEEAFIIVLQRSDVAMVSWLCCQVFLLNACDGMKLVCFANVKFYSIVMFSI